MTSAAAPSRRPLVLIVDDDPEFAATLADMLKARGCRVFTAGNGEEAVRSAAAETPDVAIVDLRLPDEGGIELLPRLRDESPATEVIVLTGHATAGSAARAISLGAAAYVEKPYDNDRLFLTLEQALARRAHQDRTAPLADALRRSALPVAVVDVQSGRLIATNPAFAGLPTAGEPGALGDLPICASDRAAVLSGHLAQLRETGQAVTELMLNPGGGGGRLFVLHSELLPGRPDTSDAARPRADLALALLLDRDARHRSEAESLRARACFEAIFDNLGAGVLVIDSHFVVREANPAIARFLGMPPGALVGRRCHELLHRRITPCQGHGEVCPIASSLASGATTRVHHVHRDSANRPHYVETMVAPLHDDSGTTVAFVAMYTDLTEVKAANEETDRSDAARPRAEAQAAKLARLNRELTERQRECADRADALNRANARLTELSRARDEFVSTVSHELRTPLTALSESLNLIADGTLGPTSDAQTRLIAVAVRNCRRLTDLINDLLDSSRLEAGRMEVGPGRLAALAGPKIANWQLPIPNCLTPNPLPAPPEEED